MLNKKILKSILHVKHTAIDDMKILPDGTIAIKAHPTKGEQCRCGICGRKSVRYDNGRGGTRSWRTCDWNTHKVYIVADIHRVMCPKHGVVTASVPWARHKSRFTKELLPPRAVIIQIALLSISKCSLHCFLQTILHRYTCTLLPFILHDTIQ